MSIDIASIMDKVESWSKSPEGKRRMNGVIEKYAKEGREVTAAGDKLVNDKTMWEAAVKFIEVMKRTARNFDLPESVMAHIENMYSGSIVKTPGGYEVPLYFGGDLHRDSLENGLGYNGVDNIVALFNNGYHAKNYVYGWWNSHGRTVRSKKDREALRFIQQAVKDFNDNYGSKYNVTAVAGAPYE